MGVDDYLMKIKQATPLNPIPWLVKWEITKLKPLRETIKLPHIEYKREYWLKHPERTLVDKTANCINRSLLVYYNFYHSFKMKGKECGIFYFKQSSGMHSECGYIDENSSTIIFIRLTGETEKFSKGGKYAFITTDKIEEVIL